MLAVAVAVVVMMMMMAMLMVLEVIVGLLDDRISPPVVANGRLERYNSVPETLHRSSPTAIGNQSTKYNNCSLHGWSTTREAVRTTRSILQQQQQQQSCPATMK